MELHVPAIQPEVLATFGMLVITNTLLTSWISILLLVAVALFATRRMELIPGRVQGAAEAVMEALIALGEQAGGSAARRFLPLVATLFLYILAANWMGVVPGVGSLQFVDESHHAITPLRSANSDLSITAAMALIVFLYVQWTGLRASPREYFKKFLWPPGLNILETIAEIARPVSLAVRLFGNIVAGFILVEVALQLAPAVVPAAALFFEMFVGLIQALIFAVLTLAFLSIAVSHGQSEEHAEEPGSH